MENENKQPTLPYVSYPAFKSFIAHLHNTVVTDQIDNTMMPHSQSGGVRAAVISALKSLGLIDAQGNTSQKLKDLADAYDAKGWPDALKKYVLSAYAGITGNIDLKSVTRKQVDDLFADTTPQMKDKCIRFFLTANKEAGIDYSPHLKIRRRLPKKRSDEAPKKSKASNNTINQPPKGESGGNEGETPSGMFDMPIPIASAEKCFIRIPRDITAEQVVLVEAAVAFIKAMAKQNEESK
jgi:hypothetical protein